MREYVSVLANGTVTCCAKPFSSCIPGSSAYHDRQRETVRLTEMVRSPLGRIGICQ